MKNKTTDKKTSINMHWDILICVFLVLATLIVYWQVGNYGFINLDDHLYVSENSHVQSGISLENIKWAFTTTRASNWHPLTWISLMLDYQLFGMRPGGYHMMNVFFHVASTLLLFLVLKRMTGALWQSAFVAALFALHPLHVESVAWISERKDVLSTFLGMLTLWAYAGYARDRGIKRYLLVLLLFTLGLMSKPMLVTLPFVLLLLDYWPLGRVRLEKAGFKKHISSAISLILEKLPLLVLAAASSIMTIIAQKAGGAVASTELFPMKTRIANALVSYISYLWKAIWPAGLTIFYPYPETIPSWQVLGAGLLLVLITLMVIIAIRRYPYLAVGWFWYLGTLVPVIGIIQVGSQAMADRYTYIPLIGIFIMIAWGMPGLIKAWPYKKQALGMAAGIVLTTLLIITHIQLGYWKDNITLFKHSVDVTPNNFIAHDSLGLALSKKGNIKAAIEQYKRALQINPEYIDAYVNLGLALAKEGRLDEAIRNYNKALLIKPKYAAAHLNLGVTLAASGRLNEAIQHYEEALKIDPYCAETHNNLAVALVRKGKIDDAISHFREALRIRPDYADVKKNLAIALESRGKILKLNTAIASLKDKIKARPLDPDLYIRLGGLYKMRGDMGSALEQYKKALSIRPDSIRVLGEIAIVYASMNEYKSALSYMKKIIKFRPNNAAAYYNVACLYARQDKIDDAIKWLKNAIDKGFDNWELIRKDPDLENVRGTKYYRQLISGHGG